MIKESVTVVSGRWILRPTSQRAISPSHRLVIYTSPLNARFSHCCGVDLALVGCPVFLGRRLLNRSLLFCRKIPPASRRLFACQLRWRENFTWRQTSILLPFHCLALITDWLVSGRGSSLPADPAPTQAVHLLYCVTGDDKMMESVSRAAITFCSWHSAKSAVHVDHRQVNGAAIWSTYKKIKGTVRKKKNAIWLCSSQPASFRSVLSLVGSLSHDGSINSACLGWSSFGASLFRHCPLTLLPFPAIGSLDQNSEKTSEIIVHHHVKTLIDAISQHRSLGKHTEKFVGWQQWNGPMTGCRLRRKRTWKTVSGRQLVSG